MPARIPFVDLKAQYRAHKKEIDSAIRTVIAETSFIGGRHVEEFERAFAKAVGAKHCVSVANGTDAIFIALKALGIGPGDEVITTAASWIATSEAVTQTGARPVFVDVDRCHHMDAAKIEEKITPRTKALLPVHLYGQPADLAALRRIARRRRLHLVEDCAQAHLAEFDGRKAGTFGVAGTFSFYPGKNLGAYGDAGAIVTSDCRLARRARAYANHGSLRKHDHIMEGVNSRLDGLQAAILSAKLPHLRDWTRRRQKIARLYDEALAGIPGVAIPERRTSASHTFHLYVIRAERRDELRRFLDKRGVQTAIHYPAALPLLKAYRGFGHTPKDFPTAYRFQKEILSLPMYPELSREAIRRVARLIREFYRADKAAA